jgi:hypothetical protein
MPLSRPSHIAVQDESSGISSVATTLNFIGAGVTASASGPTTTVNIPGGGGTAGTEFYRVAANDASAASKNGADATCDGTNDESQINTGLATGRPVWLSEGNFNLGATISVPSTGARVLVGSGWSTILNLNNSTNIYAITFAPSVSTWLQGAVLANFKINCNGNNQTTAGGGIDAFGAVWCKFDHLWILRPWENGMYVHQDNLGGYGHHNEIVNCFFELGQDSNGGNGRALRLDQSDENYVHACTFQDNGSPTLSNPCAILDLAGLNHVSDCSFVVGYGAGVRMSGAHSKVVGNTFDGCKGHNVFIAGDKNIVANNTFFNVGFGMTDNTIDAVYVENTGWNVIKGNVMLPVQNAATGRAAVSLNSSTNTIVQGNQFAPNGAFNWKTAGLIPGASTGSIIKHNYGYPTDIYVRKTADESVASSTTIQDDNHLFATVMPNVSYQVDMFVIYEGATTGDMTVGFSGPSGATFDWVPGGANNANATIQVDRGTISTTKVVGAAGTGAANHTVAPIRGLLIVGSTGGTFTFRWAQGTSDVTATTVLTGSYMRLEMINT